VELESGGLGCCGVERFYFFVIRLGMLVGIRNVPFCDGERILVAILRFWRDVVDGEFNDGMKNNGLLVESF